MLGQTALRAVSGLRQLCGTNMCIHVCKSVSPHVCYQTNVAAVRRLHISKPLQTDTYYAESHEWLKVDGDIGTIGITDHAQEQLGDIAFVDLPEVGKTFEKDEIFSVIESVKAASDLLSPVSGEIVEVNEALDDTPGLINTSPTEEGWIAKMKITDSTELKDLMDTKGYNEMIEAE